MAPGADVVTVAAGGTGLRLLGRRLLDILSYGGCRTDTVILVVPEVTGQLERDVGRFERARQADRQLLGRADRLGKGESLLGAQRGPPLVLHRADVEDQLRQGVDELRVDGHDGFEQLPQAFLISG